MSPKFLSNFRTNALEITSYDGCLKITRLPCCSLNCDCHVKRPLQISTFQFLVPILQVILEDAPTNANVIKNNIIKLTFFKSVYVESRLALATRRLVLIAKANYFYAVGVSCRLPSQPEGSKMTHNSK